MPSYGLGRDRPPRGLRGAAAGREPMHRYRSCTYRQSVHARCREPSVWPVHPRSDGEVLTTRFC